jgi:hypothetical protein
MFISRLFIQNCRNLRHFDVELGPGVTCFIGENNSGKTNPLQALRLVLDGDISAQRRRLQPEDLAAGLTFANPEHVLVSVEFSDFAGRPNEEALPFTGVLENGKARISYRFRRKQRCAIPLNGFQWAIPSQNSRSMTMFGRSLPAAKRVPVRCPLNPPLLLLPKLLPLKFPRREPTRGFGAGFWFGALSAFPPAADAEGSCLQGLGRRKDKTEAACRRGGSSEVH